MRSVEDLLFDGPATGVRDLRPGRDQRTRDVRPAHSAQCAGVNGDTGWQIEPWGTWLERQLGDRRRQRARARAGLLLRQTDAGRESFGSAGRT